MFKFFAVVFAAMLAVATAGVVSYSAPAVAYSGVAPVAYTSGVAPVAYTAGVAPVAYSSPLVKAVHAPYTYPAGYSASYVHY